jgi:hypothetical protein
MRAYIPIGAETVDMSSTDHTFTRTVHAIRANASGTFYATLRGEGSTSETSQAYTVVAGDIVLGYFVTTERATSDAAFQNATSLVGLILPEGQLG